MFDFHEKNKIVQRNELIIIITILFNYILFIIYYGISLHNTFDIIS